MIQNTLGVELDRGWLRLLGGDGGDSLQGIGDANTAAVGLLVVGYDVLGGVFALDGGALGTGDGSVHYFAPDTPRWGNLKLGHAAFVDAMLSGAITDSYEAFRWPDWEQKVSRLTPSQGLAFYPFLFSAKGIDPARCQRSAVPMTELLYSHNAAARQLEGVDAGPAIPLSRPRTLRSSRRCCP